MTVIVDEREARDEPIFKQECDEIWNLDIEEEDHDGSPFRYDFLVIVEDPRPANHHAKLEIRFERKAHPIDTPILTPDGWIPIGKLSVGDRVIGSDGNPTTITGVFPQGKVPIYEVLLTDGAKTRCTEEHLWTVRQSGGTWRTIPLKEIANSVRWRHGGYRWHLPIVEPVQFSSKNLPIHPYVLGVLLGDGCLTGDDVTFTKGDAELVENVRALLPDGLRLVPDKRGITWRISGSPGYGERHPYLIALRKLGLSGHRAWEKFIPETYLFGSVEQRVALLQGMMDTDGWACRDRTSVKYGTTSPKLTEDFIHLAESLGCVVWCNSRTNSQYTYKGNKKTGRKNWTISVKYPSWVQPFRTTRKQDSQKQRGRRSHSVKRSIKNVKLLGDAEAVCIRVANKDGLYVAERFIVTHNTWGDYVATWRNKEDPGKLDRQLSYVHGLIIEFDPIDMLTDDKLEPIGGESNDAWNERLRGWQATRSQALKHLARISKNFWVIVSFGPAYTVEILRRIEADPEMAPKPARVWATGLPPRQRLLDSLSGVNVTRPTKDGETFGVKAEREVDWKMLEEALHLGRWPMIDVGPPAKDGKGGAGGRAQLISLRRCARISRELLGIKEEEPDGRKH